MTSPHLNGRSDPDAAPERLSAAWDDLITDRPVETDDEGLVTVARQLHATTTHVRERPDFRNDLREQLMGSQPISLRQPAFVPSPTVHRPTKVPIVLDSVRRGGVRWLSIAATIALLFATAAGAYLTGFVGQSPAEPGARLAAPSIGTPETGGTPVSLGCGPGGEMDIYTPCGGGRPNLVASTGVTGDFSAESLASTSVQMQRWQLPGGQSVAFNTPDAVVTGLGMDMVVDGAYTARFSGDAVVLDNQAGIRGLYRYVPAGTAVELASGDVVTYELGTRLEVSNPLGSSMLYFKTVLFYEGDPSPSAMGASGTVETAVDGDGTLPKPLSEYGPSGAYIALTYLQVLPGYPFPPDWSSDRIILGPVDPVDGPVGEAGFVLWIDQGRG